MIVKIHLETSEATLETRAWSDTFKKGIKYFQLVISVILNAQKLHFPSYHGESNLNKIYKKSYTI